MTTTLVILDGWGQAPHSSDNAIHHGTTPNLDGIYRQYPHRLIECSGEAAGLPAGQMGNSEVGHITIGSGRIIDQSLTRIDKAIDSGSFHNNTHYLSAIQRAEKLGGKVHIIGMLSDGGVHSHINHILAFIDLCAEHKASAVLHLITDGRDTPPQSAKQYLEILENHIAQLTNIHIASVSGRYYAMDRDQRWDRIEAAYLAIVESRSQHRASSSYNAVEQGYKRGENDEFIQPTIVNASPVTCDDSIVFMNFRADRARHITEAITAKKFTHFKRNFAAYDCPFIATTNYDSKLNLRYAFKAISLKNNLGEYLSSLGKTQLRIAETEKYAHVTYFFSGGSDKPFIGETQELISSPKVATYDLQPEMSAYTVVEKIVSAINSCTYDLIVANLANGDMVGHSGNYDAALKAVAVIDDCVGSIKTATISTNNQCFITADHGNIEDMFDTENQQPHTAHTSNPVPFIYISNQNYVFKDDIVGGLRDIAPTILDAMGLAKPKEMEGQSLLNIPQS